MANMCRIDKLGRLSYTRGQAFGRQPNAGGIVRTRNLVAAIALAGAAAAIGWIAAPGNAAAAAGTLTAQDYAEIEQLYWRYNHGGDFRDNELWLSAFTDDAIFSVAGRRTLSGMEELTAMRAERDAGQGDRGRRHWTNGWRIVAPADGAEARVYWLLVDVAGGEPNAIMSGYYDDTYVKTPDGWRIKKRTINFDRTG